MSRSITLEPTPGFCVKSAIISTKTKVFINIAYDNNVPPPTDTQRPFTEWYVPVVVSDGRKDTDKAGVPCLVFDCVYNTCIKSRILRDTDGQFRVFIIELSLQRIEAQSNNTLLLSRQIKTPNIHSKGRLDQRVVTIPDTLLTPSSQQANLSKDTEAKKLIEELPSQSPTPASRKGILKKSTTPTKLPPSSIALNRPAWSWSKEPHGDSEDFIKITILTPSLTHDLIPISTLDIEPRRIILSVPSIYFLDINLDMSDAEIISTFKPAPSSSSASSTPDITSVSASDLQSTTDTGHEPSNILSLKRQRDLAVDTARAEWRVRERVLIIYV